MCVPPTPVPWYAGNYVKSNTPGADGKVFCQIALKLVGKPGLRSAGNMQEIQGGICLMSVSWGALPMGVVYTGVQKWGFSSRNRGQNEEVISSHLSMTSPFKICHYGNDCWEQCPWLRWEFLFPEPQQTPPPPPAKLTWSSCAGQFLELVRNCLAGLWAICLGGFSYCLLAGSSRSLKAGDLSLKLLHILVALSWTKA